MSADFDHRIRRIMSGQTRSPGASVTRGLLATAEPLYTAVVRCRNWLFDSGIRTARQLPRPVISVGNITTGGTGKTPMVRWLADRLREDQSHVAVLSRGYRATGGGWGDELTMLGNLLNEEGKPPVRMRANSRRFEAGMSLLEEHPDISVFLLDDGFQHRQLHRDFDLVLINATEPFGFGHVLPRGMLREPLRGLRRADAMVMTHADQVDDDALTEIETEIRRHHPDIRFYRAVHAMVGLRTLAAPMLHPPETLLRTRFFAFCGIGNPASFHRQLSGFGPCYTGHQWFPDHHEYRQPDLQKVQEMAQAAGADVLVTTEKDWVKVASLAVDGKMPVWRIDMQLKFLNGGGDNLMRQIQTALLSADRDEKRLHGGG